MICLCRCGKEFEPKRSNQRYLNAEHRQKDKNRRWPVKRQWLLPLPFRNGLGKRSKARTSGVTPLLGGQMAQVKPHAIVGPPASGSPELLTVPEVARLLRVSRWTLWEWRRNGAGPPCVRLSRGVIRYPRRILADWLNQHMRSKVSDGGTVRQFRATLRD